MEDGERGVMVFTASVAAFDGQVGQQAYSASKAGCGRHDAAHGARPGAARHPRLHHCAGAVCHAADEDPARAVQASLAASIPFPQRLGKPEEFAAVGRHIVTNGHLNGEVIRLDGALRMAPR
jgi:NAD(P)-dependent dehydrogenase (short-subunit alcohol dehydrogenase family)